MLEELPQSAYGRVFWLAYLSNAATMIAISLLVRYADFVTWLGGAEGTLGLVVGVGMIGSLVMRLAQGGGIDRYGARAIWLSSLVLFVASLLAHLWVTSADGPAIFLVRIAMQTSIAGIFGASITFISRRVPPARMAEIIGSLGTAGFIGILVGPQLADWMMGSGAVEAAELRRMFLTAAGLGVVALLSAWAATAGSVVRRARRTPPLRALLMRYHPGSMLLVAAAVGGGVSVPNTFLRAFAVERSIPRIGLFFATYALTAFATRMLTRRLFERYPPRVWVLIGLSSLSLSFLLYLPVFRTWHLIVPGLAGGVAHALLFPAVVAGGSTSFPERYRGLGTTVMLSMFDVGNLVGAPLVGGVLLAARQWGIPAYPTMILVLAGAVAGVAVYYARHAPPWHGVGRPVKRARSPRGSQPAAPGPSRR
jgi:MFS family permease